MIHRSLGPRLACVAVFASLVGWIDVAHACLTTTCAVKNPPAGCVRDPTTHCWLAGAPLQWREACVSFAVDEQGIPPLDLGYADTEALVVSAFALWPAAQCLDGFPAISVKSMGALECTEREYNTEGPNSNAVIFRTDRWPYAPEAIGITTVTFHPETGRLMDADIEVNVVAGALDLDEVRYVVAHEAGHYFGLDHSADGTAVMYEQSPGSTFGMPLALKADDVDAICLAYPMSRTVGACEFEPERGYSPVCGGDIEGSCSMSLSRKGPLVPEALAFAAVLGALVLRARTRAEQKKASKRVNRLGTTGRFGLR